MSPITSSTRAYELRHWDPGRGRPHVITCTGEFDLQAAPDLREMLGRLVELGTGHCIVDLADATFVDSTTLGVLTGQVKRLRTDEGSLVLICNSEPILRTIRSPDWSAS